jgi:hypothetical protein
VVVGREGRIDGDGDRAEAQGAQEGPDELDAVVDRDHDPVASGDAEPGQDAGGIGGAGMDLTVGDGAVRRAVGDPVVPALAPGQIRKRLGEVHRCLRPVFGRGKVVRPPSSSSGGQYGRPG